MTYRAAQTPEVEPPDVELVAATELHRRADQLRRFVFVPTLLVGIGTGIAAYLGLREWFLLTMHFNQVYVTGTLTLLPALVGSIKCARWLSEKAVSSRIPGWIDELAKTYRVSVEALEEHARIAAGKG